MCVWLNNTKINKPIISMSSSNSNQWHLLIFCSALCIAAMAMGGLFMPGQWYVDLNRAPWNPPNYVFPIAWTILYTMIAIAGWLIFKQPNKQLKALWLLQLLFNATWSWVFFGQHWVLLGLINLLILVILIAVLLFKSHQQKLKIIAWLLTPYFLWVLLASSLNAYIWLYN